MLCLFLRFIRCSVVVWDLKVVYVNTKNTVQQYNVRYHEKMAYNYHSSKKYILIGATDRT